MDGGRVFRPFDGGADATTALSGEHPNASSGMDASSGEDAFIDAAMGTGAMDAQPLMTQPQIEPDLDGGDDNDGGPEEAPVETNRCAEWETPTSGISLWLDAAFGIVADDQGRIEQWLDRSQYQHVAGAAGEPVSWPLFVPSAQQGPAVRFGMVAGTTVRRLVVADDDSLQFGTEAFAIIAVLRHHTPTVATDPELEHGAIYAKVCNNCAGYVGPELFANDLWPYHISGGDTRSGFSFMIAARLDYSAQTSAIGFNDDKLHVILARRLRDELAVDIDGVPDASGLVSSTLNVSAPGWPVTIGAHGVQELQPLEGDLFELIVMRGTEVLRAEERVDCLLRKYGFR
jgi:hypothetical protein